MSIDFDVFVGTSESVEEFGQQVEQILEVTLERDIVGKTKLNPDFFAYSYNDPERRYWFGIVPLDDGFFDDQGDMRFSTYEYQIAVAADGDTGQERIERTEEFTRSIFNRLKVAGKYRLLAAHDMAIKLDQFDPPETEQ